MTMLEVILSIVAVLLLPWGLMTWVMCSMALKYRRTRKDLECCQSSNRVLWDQLRRQLRSTFKVSASRVVSAGDSDYALNGAESVLAFQARSAQEEVLEAIRRDGLKVSVENDLPYGGASVTVSAMVVKP